MRRQVIVAVTAVVLLCACSAPVATPAASIAPSNPAPTPGGPPPQVTGSVTAGPVCPVEQNPPDPACAPRPVEGAVIVATGGDGAEVARATSDADGAYVMDIGQTGTILLTAQPVEGLMGVPEPVTVELTEPGQVVRVDLGYDTGIR